MTAIDEGTAAVVVTIITILVAPTWFAWWNTKRSRLLAQDTNTVSHATNKAVNHVPDGEPTLVQEVKTMRGQIDELTHAQRWSQDVLQKMAERVGIRTEPFDQWLEANKECDA